MSSKPSGQRTSPVQVTMSAMQQVPSSCPPTTAPVPQRWQQSLENLEAAIANMDKLSQALDGALYLDEDEWQKAVPVHKYNMAIQVQHHKIMELEKQVAELSKKLAESERGRIGAEAQIKELNGELENNARVFQLHYEELSRKTKEISDLQAVVQALSLGGGPGSIGGGSLGGGTGGPASSDGEDDGLDFGSLQ